MPTSKPTIATPVTAEWERDDGRAYLVDAHRNVLLTVERRSSLDTDDIQHIADAINREAEARAASKVPGTWVCDRCGLVIVQQAFNAQTGQVGVPKEQQAPVCPNEESTMRPQTWKEACEKVEEYVDQVPELREQLAELRDQLAAALRERDRARRIRNRILRRSRELMDERDLRRDEAERLRDDKSELRMTIHQLHERIVALEKQRDALQRRVG